MPRAAQQLLVGLSRRAQDRTSPAVVPLVPESAERTTFSRLRLAWQLPVVRSMRTSVDVGLSGEGEWGENRSLLQLPPELGGDVRGDYQKSRASGGVFGALREERGTVLYDVALRVDAASGDAVQLHPHAGVVWRPGDGSTRLHVSAGRASKLPSFFALASPPALGGNPALKPERTVGGEAGVDHAIARGRVEVGAAYFLHEYRDLVDFDFDLFLHVNRAKVRTQGVELALAWRPHRSVDLSAQATYVDAKDISGAPLLFEPHWLGSGRLTWRPDERLTAAARPARRLALPRPAADGARPRHGGGPRPPRLRGLVAGGGRPHAPCARRQPDRPLVRDPDRLPRPRPLDLGRPRLGAAIGGDARGIRTRGHEPVLPDLDDLRVRARTGEEDQLTAEGGSSVADPRSPFRPGSVGGLVAAQIRACRTTARIAHFTARLTAGESASPMPKRSPVMLTTAACGARPYRLSA